VNDFLSVCGKNVKLVRGKPAQQHRHNTTALHQRCTRGGGACRWKKNALFNAAGTVQWCIGAML